MIIKPFVNSNQAFSDVIRLFRLQKRLHTNQIRQTEDTEEVHITTTPSVPFLQPTSCHRRVLVFPVFVIIIGEDSFTTVTESQVGNLLLIDVFHVFSRVLSQVSTVFFLRASCCFPVEKKTHSTPPPD